MSSATSRLCVRQHTLGCYTRYRTLIDQTKNAEAKEIQSTILCSHYPVICYAPSTQVGQLFETRYRIIRVTRSLRYLPNA